MINIFKSSIWKKESNIDSKLIKFLCIVLILLLLSTSFIYFYFLQNIYSEQLRKSNENLVEQVAISFETMMKHITDSIYKIPLYDTELSSLIQNYSNDSQYKQDLFRHMDSIILGNQYLSSSYIYFYENDLVFDSNSGTCCSLNEFHDKDVFEKAKDGLIYMVDPHLVDTSQDKKLLISIVSPIPISSLGYKAILVVNIDARRLYFDVLKKIKAEENMNFYIYNKTNNILINKDESLLFKIIEPPVLTDSKKFKYLNLNKNSKITSLYYSQSLKWNFVLETNIRTPLNFISKLYSYLVYSIIITFLSLITVIFIVKRSTKPIKKIISDYNDKLLRDFLIDASVDVLKVEEQLFFINANKDKVYFGTLILQTISTEVNQIHKISEQIRNYLHSISHVSDTRLTLIDKNHLALIMLFNNEDSLSSCEKRMHDLSDSIYNSFSDEYKAKLYMGLGLIKESMTLLPIAYRECMESLNYKIAIGSRIMQYSAIRDRKLPYEYPYDIEKQLINNIIIGNLENCRGYIDNFFRKLNESVLGLQDSDIRNVFYQLQTAILKSVSSLPLSIKIDSSTNILNLTDLTLIKESVTNLIEKLVTEINKKKASEELDIYNRVFEYIEKNFRDENFNLNIAADELNLNRNYLSKVVKEKLNETFNDYISKKRIEIAKQLLGNKDYTVDEIAHKVGFNYSHYFIKVFKSIEGVTPGQYRDKLSKAIN